MVRRGRRAPGLFVVSACRRFGIGQPPVGRNLFLVVFTAPSVERELTRGVPYPGLAVMPIPTAHALQETRGKRRTGLDSQTR